MLKEDVCDFFSALSVFHLDNYKQACSVHSVIIFIMSSESLPGHFYMYSYWHQVE